MTGNFSVLQEGSTLIGDHKTAVDALNDIGTATTAAEAKEIAIKALQKLGEVPPPVIGGQAFDDKLTKR